MLYLLLSILFSVGVYLVFRTLSRRSVALLPVVALNYPVCVALGLLAAAWRSEAWPWQAAAESGPLLAIAALLGSMFMVMFWVAGLHSAVHGAGPTALVSRVSVALPVGFAALVYGEPFGWPQALGLLCGLGAIGLSVQGGVAQPWPEPRAAGLSALLFLGFGANDILINWADERVLAGGNRLGFVTTVFAAAGLAGAVVCARRATTWRLPSAAESFWALVLGLTNFGGFFTFVLALNRADLPATFLFPVNSVSIVALTILAGRWGFGEVLTPARWWGLLLAGTAIVLLRVGW